MINKLENDKRFLILIYSLFVIVGGIWYSNYKQIKVFDVKTNEKLAFYKPMDSKTVKAYNDGEVININTATAEELMELNGIGETIAQLIIDYRTEHGDFTSIDEIKNVNKVGDKLFEKIENNITVN